MRLLGEIMRATGFTVAVLMMTGVACWIVYTVAVGVMA